MWPKHRAPMNPSQLALRERNLLEIDRAVRSEIWHLFIELQTRAHDSPDYDKKLWGRFSDVLSDLGVLKWTPD
jgi:hypothetical protein